MTQFQNLTRISPQTSASRVPIRNTEREMMDLAYEHKWQFPILGVAPIPKTAILFNRWWLVPLAEDHSQIPARSVARVRAIYEAGIRPKAFVIAHEVPLQLRAPANVPKISPLEFWAQRLAAHSISALKIVGHVLTKFVLPATAAVLGMTLSAMVGLANVALADPCLIAVTDDNIWIQIDYWMAE